ncbi:Starch-binding associating with outer membrane [Xylanibacter ruminicola]|uniref:Starch-binding associating with outer membrane n=1 Tax=Xylanibacter ruminicola TaxID=839 RepID=A0A1M7GNE1_XYLRU|nr:RagB/SusD family nutrient uptake outer membrane protein [Xylanibacter ruminicola]MBQ4414367.1 RagB/SusD family nutrient uptake outer membrane protein [Prevotella sp.]MBR0188089.1 RagB/SusD family nutrient uptake outer membrane protein [Prevotella sp.]SFC11053.1 Starch-binding associating with outer membrane [Xylanibacter ruminicola]SHM17823.1 Starch-binding associating with outer membrane [Xylanibacter ruminicola]
MKKIYSMLFAAAAISFGATSCSDFLDEDNKTGETADLAYNTVSGIDGLIQSAYTYTHGWWGKEPSLGLAEMGSDLFYFGYDNKQKSMLKYDISAEALGSNVADNPCLDEYWEMFYAGVDVCNNALKYVPECSVIDDNKKAAYLGDAYFLRALYYSQMVAMWGPIPYNAEPINAINNNPVRVPEAEVYGNILNDLKQAMDNYKKANIMDGKSATADGRAYYYSAEALYARVALYAASWLGANAVSGYGNLYTEALNAANDVINNSGAKFYSRFSDTWNMNNEEATTNTENLFAVHYSNDLNAGRDNCVPYRFSSEGTGNFNSLITRTGYGRNGGSASLLMFVSLWNNGCDDIGPNGQKNNSIFFRMAAGKTTIKSKSTGKDVEVGKYYSPYGRGFTRYLPSLYLWQILDEIKGTDQRYNGTLLTEYRVHPDLAGNAANYPKMADQTYKTYDEAYAEDGNYFNGGVIGIQYALMDGNSAEGQALQAEAKDKYRLQFAFGGDIPVYTSGDPATALPTEGGKAKSDVYGDARYKSEKIEGRRSFPGIKKFLDDQYEEDYPTFDISHRDIMVLRLAEMYLIKAEAELATGGDALKTINQLRAARAITGKDNSISGTVTIETILKERAIELCGEYQRWFDLKRTHTLIDHVKKYNAQASGNIALKHYYRPIPLSELESVTNRGDVAVTQDANGVLQYSATQETMWQNPGY